MLVSADEQLLSLAIGNLLDNALKFSPPDMLVAVRLASVDGQGCVIITDQGCGIEPADLEQLGTPYYRAELSRQVPGLGLGFLLARRIIESHGGTLSVESTPGQGTTVTVTLQE
jgi:signal transduction histidine kinase